MAESKKNLTVKLKVQELMFDIMNKAYLTGQAREAGGKGYEEASNMQASEDDENSYQLRRSLANAFSGLKSILGEYLDEDKKTTNNIIQNEIDSDGELKLEFKLPSNYNSAAADALGGGIHEFVVGRSIYEWYRQTCPEIAEACKADAEAALDRAKKALYKRSRPERPTYTP